MEAKALVKTEGDTIAELEAHTDIDKLKEVSESARQKCCRQTDTQLDVDLKTLGNALADRMTQAPFDAVADTLAEVEAKGIGDNTGGCES